MKGRSKNIFNALAKRARALSMVFGILCATLFVISCADLREEFDPSKWRYQPVPNAPPSWENDYGRPDIDGEVAPWQ